MRLKYTVIILLLSMVNAAYAGTFVELSDFQLWSTTNGTDEIRVIPIGVSVINQGCTDPDSYMVKATLPAAAISRTYATLLAAKMASKSIKIYISGCQDNRPAILNVVIP